MKDALNPYLFLCSLLNILMFFLPGYLVACLLWWQQAIAMLTLEAGKVVPTLACLLVAVTLALHALYGEGSPLLEGTYSASLIPPGEEGSFVEGFRTFGASLGTVLAAALGDLRPTDVADVA